MGEAGTAGAAWLAAAYQQQFALQMQMLQQGMIMQGAGTGVGTGVPSGNTAIPWWYSQMVNNLAAGNPAAQQRLQRLQEEQEQD